MTRSKCVLSLLLLCFLVAAAFGQSSTTNPDGAKILQVVSAPNPHVFPLLVAMAENPNLPVRLIAVKGGPDIKTAFDQGSDVLLAMTYVGAQQRNSGAVPSLKLVLPVTWRGFWEMAPAGVKSFADLKGKTVVVSGPASPGKGGGGDIIFRAAAKAQGVDPDHDLKVVYATVKEAEGMLQSGAAEAIAVPSPASTGFGMQSRMSGGQMSSAIDFQKIFSGYSSFPKGQLPLGGIFATESALQDPAKAAALKTVLAAYADAARKLQERPMMYSNIAAEQFQKYFASTGAPMPPAMVLAMSLRKGDLVYRTDIPLAKVQTDLSAWLARLNGAAPDAGFYALDIPVPASEPGRRMRRRPRFRGRP